MTYREQCSVLTISMEAVVVVVGWGLVSPHPQLRSYWQFMASREGRFHFKCVWLLVGQPRSNGQASLAVCTVQTGAGVYNYKYIIFII